MGDYEYIYLDTAASVAEEAALLMRVLGFELIPVQSDDDDEIGLRGPASTVDGRVGLVVSNNYLAPAADPEPDRIQAIDAYRIQLEFWYRRRESKEQSREARIVFDQLAAARPETPMLLTHETSLLVAACLPPFGVHEFPDETTIDAPDADRWRPWVSGARSWRREV